METSLLLDKRTCYERIPATSPHIAVVNHHRDDKIQLHARCWAKPRQGFPNLVNGGRMTTKRNQTSNVGLCSGTLLFTPSTKLMTFKSLKLGHALFTGDSVSVPIANLSFGKVWIEKEIQKNTEPIGDNSLHGGDAGLTFLDHRLDQLLTRMNVHNSTISHPTQSLGVESGNLVGREGERANLKCNYRNFLLQRRPRDSGLGENTVVDPDDTGEEAGARERSATYPPLLGSNAESRLNLVEAGIEGAYQTESLLQFSGFSGRVTSSYGPTTTCPQLKYWSPPIFYGRKDEDASDWLERYESTVLYNRWGPAEMAENFWVQLDGAANKWFLYSGAPVVWRDTPAVAASPGVVAVPGTDCLRTRLYGAFQPQHYGLYCSTNVFFSLSPGC
ncbi:Uncharacterized protein APZ42_033854 [Daphnia magna]|uniref:Uncharacterized protein n=1 Tax=Daphnia magna TaxID=35525 RepID=A0A164KMC2_9CRUS|nr:Uncharacterized protein APZ42_033854 [Daphnia magna]